jgi:riboflavin kinase/FMN adenylyltransferase
LFRLTPPGLKKDMLAQSGVDEILTVAFDHALAHMSAEDFIQQYLVNEWQAALVIVGENFRFGYKREGDIALLRQHGAQSGFEVAPIDGFRDEAGDIISSTRIRKALAQGDLSLACGLLGYPFMTELSVIHGDKRGRELGYPTANMRPLAGFALKHGVYAVKISFSDMKGENWLDGVASFGTRPMFNNDQPLLEVHVFDWSGDLYGKELRVSFLSFLREQQRFDSVEELKAQMDRDSAEARAVCAILHPASVWAG